MNKAQEAMEILNKTGDTAEEMADFFAANNIKGVPRHEELCPCGTYLKEKLGLPVQVSPHYTAVRLDVNKFIITKNSGSVTNFVNRFDSSEFPEISRKRRSDEDPANLWIRIPHDILDFDKEFSL